MSWPSGLAEQTAYGHGLVFDDVAEAYDRHRPAYPDALVDEACATACLGPGAEVLEIGCGTGQLTSSLLARGLRVTVVEPGPQLIARARDRLSSAGEVQFVNARLEDASLPHAGYSAVFSASAIHWIDSDVGWRKAADVLVDGGSLALLSYFGLDDPRSAEDQQALRAAIATIAPQPAAAWPTYRDLASTLDGVAARRENVSEVWSWLGSHEIAREYAADLFDEVHLAAVPSLVEHTADELNALLGTMSFWAGLSPSQRDAIAAENQAFQQRIARPIRSSTVACLVMAQRRPCFSAGRQHRTAALPVPQPRQNEIKESPNMSRDIKIPGPDHPITITPSGDHVVVRSGGATIADSRSTLVLQESNYPPVRYFPLADIDRSQLVASELITHCPYKGEASYYSILADAERGGDAVWFYGDPHPAVSEIKGHVAFYADRVELSVETPDGA